MGKVKRWLVRLLGGEPASPSPVLPLNVARNWTAEHQAVLINFLRTDTGVCLMQRMRCVASESARLAVRGSGRMADFYEAIEWLESQSRIEFETISGADADQSATSAQELMGEALLREQYSP